MSQAGDSGGGTETELAIGTGLGDLLPLLREVVARNGPLSAFQAVAEKESRYSDARARSGLLAGQFSRALGVLEHHGLVAKVEDKVTGHRMLALTPRGVAFDELLALLPGAWRQFESAAFGLETEP